jgi:DHA2 family multidrug resistance protein
MKPEARKGETVSPYLILFILSFAVLMTSLDSTIVNVAIAKLQVAMGATTDAVQWVITAYLLALAIGLPAAGWCADNFGYKFMFRLALALFTTGSLLCSLSGNLVALVLSRIFQGFGAGLLTPLGTAFLLRVFPREKLGLAIALYSIPALASSSFGPTLGGLLIDNFSWQTMFIINIPVGIVAILLGTLFLPEYKKDERSPFDFPGFFAISVALTFLLFALSNGNAAWNADGWASPLIIACFCLAIGGAVLFGIFQSTTSHPLIDLSLFKSYSFSLSTFVFFVFGFALFGSDFLLPLYLQVGLGYTPTQAGMIFIPFGFVMIITNILGGKLTDWVDPRIPGMIGIALRAYGMWRFTFLTPYSESGEVLLTVCFLACGMGFLMSPLQTTSLASRPVNKAAQASGIIAIGRQLGGGFGVAILSTILVGREKFHVSALGQTMNAQDSIYKETLSRLSLHSLMSFGGTASDALHRAGGIIQAQMKTASFVASIDDVFLVAMIISIVSSIPFLFLKSAPRAKKTPRGTTNPVAKLAVNSPTGAGS